VDHGSGPAVLATVAGCIVLWGLVGARLERFDITAPIAFVALGLVVANPPLELIDVHAGSSTVRVIAELTLALVLFGDASRVNFRALRRDAAVPTRLLLIGLPLTIALGTGAALVVFGGIDPWLAALIGAAVAPTDAALGAPIMEDRRIPRRIRRILNVESGLNDGIATPFVTFFIAGAASEAHVVGASGPAAALADLGIGVLVGAVVGFAGGWLLDHALDRGWASPGFRPVAILGLALFAYAGAVQLGGNGFIAAFVGGLAFGTALRDERAEGLELVTDGGELLSVVVWFLFGTLLVQILGYSDWRCVLYAVLSLAVVRMLPVAISLLGTGLDQSTVRIIGWFGPRGLASVVFALLAFDALDTNEGRTALAVITTVVLSSVIVHGLSASPLAGWYGRRAAALEPQRPEHQPAPDLRTRPFTRSRKRSDDLK
jgi:NhaP-type Na+/H+ or K+/H+ antiporter